MKYPKINDMPLPLMRDVIHRFDEKIIDLVKVLNSVGYKTAGSCEGHINKRYTNSFPWITILEEYEEIPRKKIKKKYEKLKMCINKYNLNSEIKWGLFKWANFDNAECWMLETKEKDPEKLEKLQKSAQTLAEYLFESYK